MTEAQSRIETSKPANGWLEPVADWVFAGRAGILVVAVAAFAAFAILLPVDTIFNDGDTYWHLATGQWILDHRAVPTTDPFSYTFAGAPWQAHEWLSEVVMTLAYKAAGWNGLRVLVALAFGATAAILGAYLRRWLAPGPLLLLLGFALACGAPSLLARPHILALPVLAAWVVGLMSARDAGRAPSLWLLPLMAIWANLHGGFVLGLALIAPFALEALTETWRRPWPVIRSWGLFGVAALAMTLLTPHGVEGLIFPFKLMGMQSLPAIVEWRGADFSKMTVFEVAILEALFFCLWRGVKIPAIRLLLMLGLFHMALQHVRHQAVFALIAALLLAEPLARAKLEAGAAAPRRSGDWGPVGPTLAALGLAILAAITIRLSVPTERGDGIVSPVSALAKTPQDLRRAPVFNEYSFGGYLVFEGVQPFIDGRADMYGDDFVRAYEAATLARPAALAATLDKHKIAWTILAAGNPAVATLDELPNWRRLWADKFAVVHVRRASSPAGP
ncbi:hypothetical protein [Phenylobacterium sp. Root700]|uniref:hypothetical protein n=1 Tax=Phenylobacterium sp. Root700 TaxID=1736591 RepID=UPI0006F5F6F0|nr:hypothetical protein [Phenylobacterium sp. Root700]KRB52645.1 hypothetical protein ASE02_11725 [Phenylobacterium sp. Root700]